MRSVERPQSCVLKRLRMCFTSTGTVHIPTDEIASALSCSSRQWKERYRSDKPSHGEPIVMQCRTNRRAAWAAQIAQDAGLTNCFVYKQASTCKENSDSFF